MRKFQIYFVIMYIPRAWDYVQNWWRYRENDVFGIENDIGSAYGQIWKLSRNVKIQNTVVSR